MTDGQSASLSWNNAPIWSWRADSYYCSQVRVCWSGALFLTRGRVCHLQFMLALTSAIFLSQIPDFPFHRLLRLAGLRRTYSTPPPRGVLNWVWVWVLCYDRQSIGQFVLGYFIASYDSQGHGGGIRPRLHAGPASLGSWGGNVTSRPWRPLSTRDTELTAGVILVI
jgi:hypothetical protein